MSEWSGLVEVVSCFIGGLVAFVVGYRRGCSVTRERLSQEHDRC
jgi:hypothetical protein